MFFWDHNDPKRGDRGYHNPGEAKRVVKLVMFFVSQGYKPSDITILGAYAAQVRQVRLMIDTPLKKVWSGEISSREREDRVQAIAVL
jgi:superfamily I DNA and/or RNA helicase